MPRAREGWWLWWCHSLYEPHVTDRPGRTETTFPNHGDALFLIKHCQRLDLQWCVMDGMTSTPSHGESWSSQRSRGRCTAAAEEFLDFCCDHFEGSTSEIKACQGHVPGLESPEFSGTCCRRAALFAAIRATVSSPCNMADRVVQISG